MYGISKLSAIFIGFALTVNSCQFEKEIDYNDTFPASRLAVYAFLHEQGVRGEIRKTLYPLDINSPDSVPEARISLYENDIFLFDLLKNSSYLYESPDTFKPQEDKTYYITVRATGFETIQSSSQSLPFKILIDTCKYKGYGNYTTAYITLTDPSPPGNAYYVNYIAYLNNEEFTGNDFIDPFGVFNDNDFNNTTYTTEKELYVRVYSYNFETGTDTTYKADSAIVFLYSLSPDLKLFMESFVNYDISNRSSMYEQPFQVFSNIENGYGIFGAYSIDSCTIIFDKDSI